jgi:hypothetical protein
LQQRQGCGWIAKEVSGNMPGIQEIGLGFAGLELEEK